jgi:hypothetical protein
MADLDFEIKSPTGEVSAAIFKTAYSHALWLLEEYDSAMSGKPRGVLRWFVRKLSSDGSLHVAFRSAVKFSRRRKDKDQADIGPKVTSSLLSGLDDIETRCVTPPYLSEMGLEKAGELTKLIGRDGATGFRFQADDRVVDVTEQSSQNIRKLLPIRRTSIGSVEGRLEAINLHHKPRFIVYHAITRKAVTCHFVAEESMNWVKELLGRRVVVSGKLHKNVNGDTLRVTLEKLAPVDERNRFALPSDEELEDPDFANAGSTEEYIRRIRGG